MTKFCSICGFNRRDGLFPAPINDSEFVAETFAHEACVKEKWEYLNLSKSTKR